MPQYLCDKCQIELNLSGLNKRRVERNKHFFLCLNCTHIIQLISMSDADQKYLLKKQDISGLKYLYFENPKNRIKLFLLSDVISKSLSKYGCFDNLNKLKKEKSDTIIKATQKKRKVIELRMKELQDTYKLNKLHFRYIGDAYSYINYGKPSIQNIIKNELKKVTKKTKRKIRLANSLKEKSLPFDESMRECYDYINRVGTRNLKETVEEIEIELFLQNNTEYKKYLREHDRDQARHLAYQEYINGGNLFPSNLKYSSDIVLYFD